MAGAMASRQSHSQSRSSRWTRTMTKMRHRAVVVAAFAAAQLVVGGNSTPQRASVDDEW